MYLNTLIFCYVIEILAKKDNVNVFFLPLHSFLSQSMRFESADPDAINVVNEGAFSDAASSSAISLVDFGGGRCTVARHVTGPECPVNTCSNANSYDVIITSST
jgi:hypothetical protein